MNAARGGSFRAGVADLLSESVSRNQKFIWRKSKPPRHLLQISEKEKTFPHITMSNSAWLPALG